jgi:ribosomal protein S27AE
MRSKKWCPNGCGRSVSSIIKDFHKRKYQCERCLKFFTKKKMLEINTLRRFGYKNYDEDDDYPEDDY